MKKLNLQRTILYSSIAAIVGTASSVSFAQDAVDEEVIVTGIRASLENAADIKREANGVVDAISAEDIGKFPDANLAESLQRITGVSIDRQNNEGNQITVRGLGPNFNLVTLNGRQMPVASSPEQESIASATQSRAFNFAEIASESVSGVEVYKTARADVPTGGIGATVNIKTARPFDYDDTKIVLNATAIHDASVEEGDDITPEIGGLFSTTFADGKVGFLANFSFSERHFSEVSTHTDGFLRDQPSDGTPGPYEFFCNSAGSNCGNAPFVYRPVTNISEIRNFERRRTNGQLVAQFAPVDNLVITFDYVLSRFERDEDRFGTGLFGVVDAGTSGTSLTENFTVSQVTRSGFAADSLVYDNELVVENDSFGINVDWQVNDTLSISLDAHSSKAESQPDGELNDNLAIVQGPLGVNQTLTYTPGGVNIDIDASGARRGTCAFGNGTGSLVDTDGDDIGDTLELDANGVPCGELEVSSFRDPNGFSPLGSVIRNIAIENTVDQLQLQADWEFDGASITAGASYVDYQVDTLATSTGFFFQGLVPCTTCVDDIQVRSIDAPSGFNEVVVFDVNSFVRDNFPTQPDDIIAQNPPTFFGSSEESLAAYVVASVDADLNGLPAKITAGVRYEGTEVEGSAFQTFPTSLTITSNTEGTVNFADGASPEFFTTEGDYEVFLPSFDFAIFPTDEQVARFSYGRTIARPDLNALRPITTISDFRPGTATASSGNPALQPYTSDNIDLSYEWYYSEGSYLSVAYFFKQIDDYITTDVETDTILDVNGNPLLDPRGRFVSTVGGAQADPVTSQAGDPEAIFEVTRLLNSEQRSLDGWELAIQHLFGETGFGVQANYTVVSSDAEFDPNNFETQAILLGLSDSANLVGFYENEVFSVRLAANWRDEFLLAENQLRATNEPVFVDEYLQVDFSSSYNVSDNIAVSFEILNLFGEDQFQRGRYNDQFLFENDQEPRYSLGVRANF